MTFDEWCCYHVDGQSDVLDPKQMAEHLRGFVLMNFKTQTEAARTWGINEKSLSAILNGHRAPPASLLKRAGLERITVYRTGV